MTDEERRNLKDCRKPMGRGNLSFTARIPHPACLRQSTLPPGEGIGRTQFAPTRLYEGAVGKEKNEAFFGEGRKV